MSSVSGFVDSVAPLGSDKVVANLPKLIDVVFPTSDSLEMDLQSILELLRAAGRGG